MGEGGEAEAEVEEGGSDAAGVAVSVSSRPVAGETPAASTSSAELAETDGCGESSVEEGGRAED